MRKITKFLRQNGIPYKYNGRKLYAYVGKDLFEICAEKEFKVKFGVKHPSEYFKFETRFVDNATYEHAYSEECIHVSEVFDTAEMAIDFLKERIFNN